MKPNPSNQHHLYNVQCDTLILTCTQKHQIKHIAINSKQQLEIIQKQYQGRYKIIIMMDEAAQCKEQKTCQSINQINQNSEEQQQLLCETINNNEIINAMVTKVQRKKLIYTLEHSLNQITTKIEDHKKLIQVRQKQLISKIQHKKQPGEKKTRMIIKKLGKELQQLEKQKNKLLQLKKQVGFI